MEQTNKENLPETDGEQDIDALLKRIRESTAETPANSSENPSKQEQPFSDEDAGFTGGEPEESNDEIDSNEISISRKQEPFALNLENDKEYQSIRSYHKEESKKQHKFLRFLLHLLIALCILAGAAGLGYVILEGITDILGIHQPDQEIIVEIPRGSSLTDIANILEERGVVRSGKLFKGFDPYANVNGDYQFGTFVLNTKMSYEEIMIELKQYNIAKESVRITFPEGSNLFDIAKLLEKNGVCKADDFLSAINETNFGYSYMDKISDKEMKYFKMEGYAFPDTYDFYLEDNPVSVAQRFLNNLDKKFTSDMYARLEELDISFEDFMTLASIVQAEAMTKEQMENVASVYWNRLNHSSEFPKLQADPTRVYGRALKADMQIINRDLLAAYDTYESEGLPPGPICNPGLDAIMATLYPAETNYYYFCSDLKTGECYYAETLEQHNKNLRICGLA